MILYQLRCGNEHEFEAWFKDSASYDVQARDGHVECPYCGDVSVSKAPMAPNLARHGLSEARALPEDPNGPPEARAREVAEQILDAVKRLRGHIEDNTDYVGDDFAEEARRMHHGETEERAIWGEATSQEAEDLQDEGIEFYRLPPLPRREDS